MDVFWKDHVPAMLHCMFTMHTLIEASLILEGTIAHHMAWSLKFSFSHRDILTEEKNKQNTNKNTKEIKQLASMVLTRLL